MKEYEIRKRRKEEHIKFFLKSSNMGNSLLKDVYIEHNPLPELNLDEIRTDTRFLGKKMEYPIMINAMTGGTEEALRINKNLSKIASYYKMPIAVGSQTIALKHWESRKSFEIVRDIMGDEGVVIANINARASLKDIELAVGMLRADAIQLHLNPAQELVMAEGDRKFKGIIRNIEKIIPALKVPVIVKEVGFGIPKDVACRLYDAGIRHIDISGKGGTNFIEIEDRRNKDMDFTDIYPWGNPTAYSLIQCRPIGKDLILIASGGIKSSLDILKCLVLGADMVGIGGTLLRRLLEKGYGGANKYMRDSIYKLKALMLLTGSKNMAELKDVPYKTSGQLRELLD